MNIDAYLTRIGLSRPLPPTLETLKAVHRAHLRAIPYENLDVQFGRPVTIERPAIFEKIVGRRRGGWCYEMNGLLGWALGELGFKVTRATGAVMRELAGEGTLRNHLVFKVELDEGLYLADVGFGDGPIEPIRLVEGPFESGGLPFSLTKLDEDWWRLRNHPHGGAPSFDFNLAPVDEALLAAKCDEQQYAPQSHFVLNLFCFRFRPDGVIGVRGRVVRTVTPQGYEDRILNSADELVRFFDEELDLRDPELASLWPKICARHEVVMAEAARQKAEV
jgi:N-hydroxyarylamine O-acetyltransferase